MLTGGTYVKYRAALSKIAVTYVQADVVSTYQTVAELSIWFPPFHAPSKSEACKVPNLTDVTDY